MIIYCVRCFALCAYKINLRIFLEVGYMERDIFDERCDPEYTGLRCSTVGHVEPSTELCLAIERQQAAEWLCLQAQMTGEGGERQFPLKRAAS